MRPVTGLLHVGAGVFALCASGCFGPMYSPYGGGAPGYGSYSYPGYGGATYPAGAVPGSMQTLTPGPQYVPNGSIPAGAAPTPTYGPSSNAPPYGAGSNMPVPNPADPGPYYPETGEAFPSPRSGVNAAPTPNGDASTALAAVHAPPAASLDGPRFAPVAMERTRPAEAAEATVSLNVPESIPSVTGVVRYNPLDRKWRIACTPDSASATAAAASPSMEFVLADSPLLQTLRDGERVRLEGRADATSGDGPSVYLAERIIRGDV